MPRIAYPETPTVDQTDDYHGTLVPDPYRWLEDVDDDSIVRGTNIRKIIRGMKNVGAKEVHVRIGCPPLIAPCYLGIDMRSKKEFIARNIDGDIKPGEKIAQDIQADSLGYISIEGLKKAIGFDVCKGCIEIPEGYPPEMRNDAEKLFKNDKKGIRAYECI